MNRSGFLVGDSIAVLDSAALGFLRFFRLPTTRDRDRDCDGHRFNWASAPVHSKFHQLNSCFTLDLTLMKNNIKRMESCLEMKVAIKLTNESTGKRTNKKESKNVQEGKRWIDAKKKLLLAEPIYGD